MSHHPGHLEGFEVPLTGIENALRMFWQSTARDAQTTIVKATTLNLIIFTTSPGRYSDLIGHITDLTYHHPGRIFIVLIDRDAHTDQVSAHISAYCQLPRQDNQQICCEIITLGTGPAGVRHLSGALLPLLLPGLPVFACVTDVKLLENLHLEYFFRMSDRIIVDFAEMPCSEIQTLAKHLLALTQFSDISWLRLAPWREAVAQFFDPIPGLALAGVITDVHIEYARNKLLSAFLILGWLASQLQWVYAKNTATGALFLNHDKAPVVTSLKNSDQVQDHAGLLKISMKILYGSETRIYTIEVKNETALNRTCAKDGLVCSSQDMELYPVNDVELLCQELDSLQLDPTFMPSFGMVRILLDNRIGSVS
jgi:glucose-6-phosphate dehydrogenase assembly protein OpcA